MTRPGRPLRAIVLAALAVLWTLPACGTLWAAEEAPAPSSVERLARLGRLWGTVRYLHPWLAYKDIDLDAPLLRAIPRVRTASSREEYAAAVREMLAALGDPATHLQEDEQTAGGGIPTVPGHPLIRWDQDVLIVDVARFDDSGPDVQKAMDEAGEAIAKARAVVVELRVAPPPGMPWIETSYFLAGLGAERLASRPVQAPAQRYLQHSGYRSQMGPTGYTSAFVTETAESFTPPPGITPKRVAFVLGPTSDIPGIALALQASGDGAIFAAGPLREESVVRQRVVDLGEDLRATVRMSEVLPMFGWSGIHADQQFPVPAAGQDDPAFAAALRWVKAGAGGTSAPAPTAAYQSLPDPVWRPDRTYEEMTDPSPEHRLLAVFRTWNIIDFFYPYKHLIGDWDAVLPEFIERMEKTRGAEEYALTMAEMGVRVADSHTVVEGHPDLTRLLGEAGVPVELRWIEGRYVVVELGDASGAPVPGLQRGDVVVAVDGKPVEERIARLRPYLAGSHEATLMYRLGGNLLRGPAGSTVILTVSGTNGTTRDVKLTRALGVQGRYLPRKGEIVRILPNNLGYVDLARLTVPEVGAMFETLKDTRGIVFDMRGYPNGTAWSIAPRLNVRNARGAAYFCRMQVSPQRANDMVDNRFCFVQPLPPTRGTKYAGPTVMLIDERTISQAEHTGLFFEVANGTRFVGTPSAGANGDITYFTLPGGVRVRFTGHDVRHADGRQLQRVGLRPDVEAAPTIEGIRAGRDEVLERAVQDLEEKLSSTSK